MGCKEKSITHVKDVNQEEDEICITKLQPGPPYTCQMLKVDEKQKLPNSKYNFGITKANKIVNLLLKDKQIAMVIKFSN